MSKSTFILVVFGFITGHLCAQCDIDYPKDQSPKIANYTIKANLDHAAKMATCQQKLVWKNTSPDTISELRFYMYMNAFRDTKTTYLKGASTIFRQDLNSKPKEEWGYITVTKVVDENGTNLSDRQQYISPNDGNTDDESVLALYLETPINPGASATFDLDFVVKMPKTIVRSGYGQKDFFLFVHWFPQVGVYEQNKTGDWGWNCHQFFRGTEFFADFGDYDVEINASDHLVIGGSGCKIEERKENGRQIVHFQAHDLIDFGWVVYSEFDVYTHRHNGVDIEILMPPEHCAFADRYLKAVTHGLDYMSANVGPYPWPKITVVDPPVHTLNSGFMEYPMMITAASFYGIPRSVRSVESLVIHEFNHMYFMGTLASNEKEEAWLDEGFVTYFEDRVTDHFHGEKESLFNVLGFKSGNAENSRLEFTSLPNPKGGPIARPGWEHFSDYKGIIYAKTSSVLRTLEGLVGKSTMDKIIKVYYEKHKFTHPKEADFRQVVKDVVSESTLDYAFDQEYFFEECLHQNSLVDYEITDFSQERGLKGRYHVRYTLNNNGTLNLPVDVETTYVDGSQDSYLWDGNGKVEKKHNSDKEITAVEIDPNHKINLDMNFNNNSFLVTTNQKPLAKYSSKTTHWMQNILELASFLF